MNSPLLTLENIADINFNIIVKIYRLLDFIDQLRLAQTSQWLKQIFTAKIWTPSYKTLRVDSVEDELSGVNRTLFPKLVAAPNFFNIYEMNGKRICLHKEEFTEFVALYANEVTELIACDNCFPDIKIFKNITSIKSKAGVNVEQHLKIVTENCPNLQSFEVEKYGRNMKVDIDYLFKLRHLKVLSLDSGFKMQYEQFCNIIRKLNLECFRLRDIEVNVTEIIHVETPKFLTELRISLYDSRLLAWNFNIFENLLRLNLFCLKIMNANDWNIFCTAARRLETITMIGLKMPEAMKTIIVPTSLKEVSIEQCENLTDQHLTQILNLPNLLKFSSTRTYYKITTKDFVNYKLPPQLQSLNFQGITTLDLLTSIENNQLLKELSWYNYKKNSLLHEDNRLLFCKSLETLNVESGPFASNAILRMQNLSKLSLCIASVFKWSDVIALIKHSILKELYIMTEPSDESSVSELVEGFPINLRVLSIESRTFKLKLNFWLNLLCKNLSRLKLIVQCLEKDYLEEVVGHKNFPKRTLSTITYDNYIVDCKTLQMKFHDKVSASVPILSSNDKRTLILCNDKIE